MSGKMIIMLYIYNVQYTGNLYLKSKTFTVKIIYNVTIYINQLKVVGLLNVFYRYCFMKVNLNKRM